MAQGATTLMSKAAGTRMALLIIEPLATAQTTGNSRSAFTPVTCCALSARSSPSTPAVFFTASLRHHGHVIGRGCALARGDLGHHGHIVQDGGDVVDQ